MPPDQRFETFVAAPPAALAQLRALARGEANEGFYVEGAHGTGKSHLLRATCAEADSLGRRIAYLPLASLRGRLRDALELVAGRDLSDLSAIFERLDRASLAAQRRLTVPFLRDVLGQLPLL